MGRLKESCSPFSMGYGESLEGDDVIGRLHGSENLGHAKDFADLNLIQEAKVIQTGLTDDEPDAGADRAV